MTILVHTPFVAYNAELKPRYLGVEVYDLTEIPVPYSLTVYYQPEADFYLEQRDIQKYSHILF